MNILKIFRDIFIPTDRFNDGYDFAKDFTDKRGDIDTLSELIKYYDKGDDFVKGIQHLINEKEAQK